MCNYWSARRGYCCFAWRLDYIACNTRSFYGY
uniref:Uncharacterized protein n=1 Tax=Myoviridae sp. ctv9K3 TaxID=2825203 RepID=A0A8S5PYA9_9CAUD|nr:MAG TPA: hypothetical protein [Myoviridae sp. ctv9K3]